MKRRAVQTVVFVMWLPLILMFGICVFCEFVMCGCERIGKARWSNRLVEAGERFAKRHGVEL